MNRRRVLFYPCAGNDIETPVAAFGAVIDEFGSSTCTHINDGYLAYVQLTGIVQRNLFGTSRTPI